MSNLKEPFKPLREIDSIPSNNKFFRGWYADNMKYYWVERCYNKKWKFSYNGIEFKYYDTFEEALKELNHKRKELYDTLPGWQREKPLVINRGSYVTYKAVIDDSVVVFSGIVLRTLKNEILAGPYYSTYDYVPYENVLAYHYGRVPDDCDVVLELD